MIIRHTLTIKPKDNQQEITIKPKHKTSKIIMINSIINNNPSTPKINKIQDPKLKHDLH